MSEVMDYNSRLSDPASRKFETFSYLPAMDTANIKKQVEYLVKKGWNPAIEHIEPEYLMDSYWYMWKLPMLARPTWIAFWPKPRPATRPTRPCRYSPRASPKRKPGAWVDRLQ